MKMLKNLKKNNKGFTLIEIVIVIVIIAILAAMLVPSLLKWVDNANKKSFLEAANSIKTSTLSIATENYATSGAYTLETADWDEVESLVGSGVTVSGTVASTYTAPTKTADAKTYAVAIQITDSEITKMTVTNSDYKVTFESGAWGEVDAA